MDMPLINAAIRQQALSELNRLETDADAEQLLAELRATLEP